MIATDSIFRGRFALARAGVPQIVVASATAAVFAALVWPLCPPLGLVAPALPLFLIWFFRDPHRRVTNVAGELLAPADGIVDDIAWVDEVEGRRVRMLRLGIYLSLFSVHVQRAPLAGTVLESREVAGRRVPTRRVGMTDDNQRHVTVLEPLGSTGALCIVRQIAGPIARGILNVGCVGRVFAKGQRLGLIRFGSRVEVFVSADLEPSQVIAIGSRVRAGITILANTVTTPSVSRGRGAS